MWNHHLLSQAVTTLNKYNAEIVSFDMVDFYNESEINQNEMTANIIDVYNDKYTLIEKSLPGCTVFRFLFQKSILKEAKFNIEYYLGEDLLFKLKATEICSKTGIYRLTYPVSIINEGNFYQVDGTYIHDNFCIKSMNLNGD